MGKAGVVCGIGFCNKREGGVMPIHRFYWELIARQNWEAIGIDQRLYERERRMQTSKQAAFAQVIFLCSPQALDGRHTSSHTSLFAHLSFIISPLPNFSLRHELCFASAVADFPFLAFTVFLVPPLSSSVAFHLLFCCSGCPNVASS